MSSVLTQQQQDHLERLLFGLHFWEDPGKRKVFLAGMLRGHPIWLDLCYQGSQREVAESLLALCGAADAKLLHGQPPLCALLQALRKEYGEDQLHLSRIDQLAAELCLQRRPRERSVWEGSPYRGLNFFDRRHAPIFFGREAELERLIDALGSEQGRRFLMIVGASGSGKSSLVRAGLWARLARGAIPGDAFRNSEQWLVSVMTPSDAATPIAALVEATRHAVWERDGFEHLQELDWPRIANDLSRGKRSLADLALQLLPGRRELRWFLILDQMEELFTTVDSASRELFIEQLIDATKRTTEGHPACFQAVATLRADFFHYCVNDPVLSSVVERAGTFPLRAPDRLSLERMVTGPLTELDLVEKDEHGNRVPVRWVLDPSLAPRISADAAEHDGGLALMAFALRELYDACYRQRRLSLDVYQSPAFGGLAGAVSRRADKTLRELGDGADDALTRVFVHLVHIADDQTAARRRAPLETWNHDPKARDLIDAFVRARLLVADHDSRGVPTLQIAHEVLLREWPRLLRWLNDYSDALRLRKRVQNETGIWLEQHMPAHGLWRHEQLDPARRLLSQAGLLDGLEVDPKIADFLTPEADRLLAELLCSGTDPARRDSIGRRVSEIGDPRRGVGLRNGLPDIDWCSIPGGEVDVVGCGTFTVAPFRISAFPITVKQYRSFLDAEDGYCSVRWWRGLGRESLPTRPLQHDDSYPADSVSLYDAVAFCRWLTHRLGYRVRLPDEREWQWAAQSARAGFVYPWSHEWIDGVANTTEAGIGRTIAVGMYPGGRSDQGVYDLAGNVWEWCQALHDDPARHEQAEGELGPNDQCVLRGGSWLNLKGGARASTRYLSLPDYRGSVTGFRLACNSSNDKE